MNKLTAIGVKNARPKHAHRATEIAAGGGLYLVVQPSGAKGWTLRYRFQGRPRNLKLGNVALADNANDGLTLATARSRAAEARVTLERGIDPADRRPSTGPDRVEALVEQFVKLHVRPKTRASTAYGTEGLFRRYVLPVWRGRSIGDIRRRDVVELVEKIAVEHPYAANRTLAALSKFSRWLVARDVIPMSFTSGVPRPHREVPRQRTLTDSELRSLWLATADNDPASRAIRLMVLTGARRNEVSRMRYSEIDTERRIWTIPAARSKNHRSCDVPLSPQAWDILTSVPPIAGSDFVFTLDGRVPVNSWSEIKPRLSTKAGIDPASWRLHDLRRTTAAGLQALGLPIPVIEKALNHTSGSFRGIVGTYQVHEYREEISIALQRWADRVDEIASGTPAKVLKLPRRLKRSSARIGPPRST